MKNIHYDEISQIKIFGIHCKIVDESNINILYTYRNNDYIRKIIGDKRFVPLDVLKFWLQKTRKSHNCFPYLVYSEDNPVAYTEIKNVDYDKKTCEVGIFLFDEKYFGTGLAERIALFWEFICSKMDIKTYYSKILKNNIRSIKFIKKIGGRYLKKDNIFLVLEHNVKHRIHALTLVASKLDILDEYESIIKI